MNIKNITEQISKLRDRIKKMIQRMPEAATGVTILKDSPRCGAVNFSTIAKNKGILSPDYYLNGTVKERLIQLIDKTQIEKLKSTINKIIETGSIQLNSSYPCTQKLNPEFINELKKIYSSI